MMLRSNLSTIRQTEDRRRRQKRRTEQELPDLDQAIRRAHESVDLLGTTSTSSTTFAPRQCICKCPHLKEFLPHELSLELAQTAVTGAWTVKDPVHALHLASQMDVDPTTGRGLVFRGGNVSTASSGPTMILFGDEQERLLAFATRGFSEQWHPFSFNWETLHRKERLQEEARQRRLAAEKVAAAAMAATATAQSNKTTATPTTAPTATAASGAVTSASLAVSTATATSATTTTAVGGGVAAAAAAAAAGSDKPHLTTSSSLEAAKIKTEVQQDTSAAAAAKSSEAMLQEVVADATPLISDASLMQVEPTDDNEPASSHTAVAALAAAPKATTTDITKKPADAVQSTTINTAAAAALKQEDVVPAAAAATTAMTTTITTETTEPMQVDPLPIKEENPDVVMEPVMSTSAPPPAASPPPPPLPPMELKTEEESLKQTTDDKTAKRDQANDEEKSEQVTPEKTKETVVEASAKEANVKTGSEQLGEDKSKDVPSAEQVPSTTKWADTKPTEQKVEGTTAIPKTEGPKTEDKVKSSTTAAKAEAAIPSNAPTTAAPAAQGSTDNVADTKSAVAANTATTAERKTPIPKEEYLLDEARYWSFQSQEAHISQLRKAFFTKRSMVKKKSAPTTNAKRRKSETKGVSLTQLPAWREHSIPPYKMDLVEENEWHRKFRQAETKIERWLHYYRHSRQVFWQEELKGKKKKDPSTYVFGALDDPEQEKTRCCRLCDEDSNQKMWLGCNEGSDECSGDSLMQCLECSFVGCVPPSVSLQQTNDHMMQHHLMSNHTFAATCGPQANVFCFKCMDFVYHEIFDMEKERIDLNMRIPWMGWKHHPVQRSFDAFQFVRVPDHGIVWKGMHAAYLTSAPAEHVRAARAARWRQIVFHGEVDELPLSVHRSVVDFSASQGRLAPRERSRIPAPVGMYNLGNTCFQSAVLQCLIACVPIQKYFLHDMMHHHASCAEFRKMADSPALPRKTQSTGSKSQMSPCLACELDKLILRYLGSARGADVFSAVTDTALIMDETPIPKGEPLVTSEMLTSAWNCGGMNHLAGYDQRDAHEFLHGFLDNMSKHDQEFHHRIALAVGRVDSKTNNSSYRDVVKTLLEGTFRSVLVCQQCGNKRAQSESFMSISLDLSKEVHRATAEMASSPSHVKKLSVERCLRHFTMPETLADPVDCPSCKTKTLTKKQHVISKLPRVLCLHLKRFNAAHNAKVEDFVSFPEKDLNMGQYLPHWCEVPRVPSNPNDASGGETAATAAGYVPDLSYDLFATVNHFGNMQSGHYMANVLVDGMWYHCNDAHVSYAGNKGNGASQVLASDGAYLLFYIRK